jgi:hypothetical protein
MVNALRFMGRLILLGTVSLLVFPMRSPATGPEGAWGKYSYRDKDLDIVFSWDIGGIKNVRVGGRTYAKVVSPEKENGDNFGSEGVFPFWVVIEETDKGSKRLDLLLLFENGKLKCVAGLYSQAELLSPSTKQSRVTRAKVFQLHFSPL